MRTDIKGGIGFIVYDIFNMPLTIYKTDGTEYAYVYGPTGLSAMRVNSAWYYLLKDHLGSTKLLVNSSGTAVSRYEYDPYGKIVDSYVSADGKYLFTGQELETSFSSTSLWNFRARGYDSEIGLFHAVDPARQTYSPLGYAAGNPINFVDPTGREASAGGNAPQYDDGRTYWGRSDYRGVPELFGADGLMFVEGGGGGGGGGASNEGLDTEGYGEDDPSKANSTAEVRTFWLGMLSSLVEYSYYNEQFKTFWGVTGKWYSLAKQPNGTTGTWSEAFGFARSASRVSRWAFGIGTFFIVVDVTIDLSSGNKPLSSVLGWAALDVGMGYVGLSSPLGAGISGCYFIFRCYPELIEWRPSGESMINAYMISRGFRR